MVLKRGHFHVIALIIFVSFAVFSLREVLVTPGLIEYRDLTWPYDLSLRLNSVSSTLNLDWLKRVYEFPVIFFFVIAQFPSEFVEKGLFFGLRMLTCLTTYFVVFRLFYEEKKLVSTFLTSLFGGLLAVLNPIYVSMVSATHYYALSYALLPLIFYYYDKSVRARNLRDCILCSLFLSLAIASVIHYMVLLSIALFTWFILSIIYVRRPRSLVKSLVASLTVISLTAAISSYWILPTISVALNSEAPHPGYVLTYETLQVFSRPSLLDVFRLLGDQWPRVSLVQPPFSTGLHFVLTFVYPLLAFSSLFFLGKIKDEKLKFWVMSLSFLAIIIIFFNKGLQEPFGEIYPQFYRIPAIGWLFRVPSKFAMILGVTYTLLATVTVHEATTLILTTKELSKKHRKAMLGSLYAGTLLSAAIVCWPLFTGDMNGALIPEELPDSYIELDNWLKDQTSDFNVFNYPSNSPWGISKPPIDDNELFRNFCLWIMLHNELKNVSELLKLRDVKYMIVNEVKGQEILQSIGQSDLTNVISFGDFSVFENPQETTKVWVPGRDFSVLESGLSTLSSLSFFQDLYEISLSYLNGNSQSLLDNSHFAILPAKDFEYSCVIFSSKSVMISPFSHTLHHEPSEFWSKAATDDPSHGSWHYYLETRGMENWQFDYGTGLVFAWATSPAEAASISMEMPFELEETGDYVFLIRYFRNQQGGEIQIQLDDTQYMINAKDQLDTFVWKELSTTYLGEGQHKITITNIEGFNAVNLFTLIPKQEYQETRQRLEQILQDKEIVYILEAETDLYHENTTTGKYGGEASNGRILILDPNSTVWQEFFTPKPGQYRIAARSRGQIQIGIDDQTHTFNSTTLEWNYLSPIYLDKGMHEMQIATQTNAELDVIYLFSTQNSNETLQDIFVTPREPIEIINQTRIDNTKYIINVNATRSFMLAFAEVYDPSWAAYVNNERVASTTLYGIINGFRINSTGQMSITIKYEPQEWFYYGAAISLTAFLLCLVYLVVVWTKKKWGWFRPVLAKLRS